MTEVALSVEALSVRFGAIEALREVSFELGAQERVALIGPNGAGKTTLLDCVSGFRSPDHGTIRFRGRDLVGRAPHSIAGMGLSRSFQGLRLRAEASVLENVVVGCSRRSTGSWWSQALSTPAARQEERAALRAAEELLDFFGLAAQAEVRVGDLPQGSCRKVELARTLIAQPDLVLLDEPGAGLSLEEKDDLAKALDRYCDERSIAILLIDHDLRFVRSLIERWIVLDRGGVIADGSADEISLDPRVRSVFLGETQ